MARRLRRKRLSPWVELCAIDIGEPPNAKVFHAFALADYASVLAFRPDGRIAIVRQYRPIMDQVTWELPSGMIDPGEDAATAAARETAEETGFEVVATRGLAPLAVDGGRLLNRSHGLLAVLAGGAPGPREPDIEVGLVTWDELAHMLSAGALVQANHAAVIAQAMLDPEAAAFLRAHDVDPPWSSAAA